MTITRPELANTIHHITDCSIPSLHPDYYPITDEWIMEFNRMIHMREIDMERVKCIVVIEDEGEF